MMNKFMRHVLCYGVSALLFSGSLCAETLTADIVFDKKPPKVGVLYVPGSGAPINGELNQKDKKFLSKMVVISPNSTISFKNSDSLDHNIFANDMKTGVRFDVGLMPVGGTIEKEVDWSDKSIVRVGCKIHPTMKAYIANVQADVFEALEFEKKVKEYSYSLENVNLNGGAASVNLSLLKYDPIELTLKKGEKIEVELLKKGKKRGTATFELK